MQHVNQLIVDLGHRKRKLPHAELVRRFEDLREIESYIEFIPSLEGVRLKIIAEIVYANVLLANWIAQRRARGRLPIQDSEQEGNIGLMRAVQDFDHTLGTQFSTYAIWWVRQAIDRACEEQDTRRPYRIPSNAHDDNFHVAWALGELEQTGNRDPTPEEVLAVVRTKGTKRSQKMDLMHVQNALRRQCRTYLSLDQSVDSDDRSSADVSELVGREPMTEQYVEARRFLLEKSRLLVDMMSKVDELKDPRYGEILRARLGLQGDPIPPLQVLGTRFGISRERVRQMEASGMKALSKIFGISVDDIKKLPRQIEELKRIADAL